LDRIPGATPLVPLPPASARGGRLIVYTELDPKTQIDPWALPVTRGQNGAL